MVRLLCSLRWNTVRGDFLRLCLFRFPFPCFPRSTWKIIHSHSSTVILSCFLCVSGVSLRLSQVFYCLQSSDRLHVGLPFIVVWVFPCFHWIRRLLKCQGVTFIRADFLHLVGLLSLQGWGTDNRSGSCVTEERERGTGKEILFNQTTTFGPCRVGRTFAYVGIEINVCLFQVNCLSPRVQIKRCKLRLQGS